MHATESAPAKVWEALETRDGPWRTPVLANLTPAGEADARIVVLREVSPGKRELVFFTDRRSNKYAALLAAPSVCLVIYDGVGWQVRLYGDAREETAKPALDAWWNALGSTQRAHYGNDSDSLGDEKGRENFAAFRVTIDRFHCLWLHDEGNEAVEFRWHEDGWEGTAVRP